MSNKNNNKLNNRNIIVRQNIVIYNALTLYDNDTTFRLPDYLLNIIEANNRKLLLKHKGKTVRLYTQKELLENIISVGSTTYEGSFENKDIRFNLLIVQLTNDEENN